MTTFKDELTTLLSLAGQEAGEGLKEVILVPWGTVESRKGTFIVDEESARMIVADFDKHGTPVSIDYDHQGMGGKHAAPDGRAPAAGFVHKMYAAPGIGIKGLVEWNDRARELIRAGEYRYLSPMLFIRKSDRRVMQLPSAAITNRPAIPRMERLAASTGDEKESPMPEPEDNGNQPTPDQKVGRIAELLKKKGVDIPEGADRDAVLDLVIAYLGGESKGKEDSVDDEAVASSVRSVLGLAPDASKDEVILAMSTGDSSGAGRRLAVMQEADAQRIASERVAKACKENRINPHDTTAMSAAMSLAREQPERFDAIMAACIPHVAPGRTAPPPRPDQRGSVIVAAAREFHGDDSLQATTSVGAYIDLKLRDEGFTAMSDDEKREHVTATV